MEVCRKCKLDIKEDEKFIEVFSSLTLGMAGSGKYHLKCWKKSRKNAIIAWVITVIVMIIILIWHFLR